MRLLKVLTITTIIILLYLPAVVTGEVSQGNRLDGKELLTRAKNIFIGTLVRKEFERNRDNGVIFTRYIFDVGRSLKGEAAQTIELIEYGGTLKGETHQVSHTPRYIEGESYLVFSYLSTARNLRTLAGPAGQLPVISGGSGRKAVLIPPGHPLMEVFSTTSARNLYELEDFSQTLRSALMELAR